MFPLLIITFTLLIILSRFFSIYNTHHRKAGLFSIPYLNAYSASSTGYESLTHDSGSQS